MPGPVNGEKEIDAKVVLLGNAGVGKTSLALRYVQDVYQVDQTSTIGASFMTKRIYVDSQNIKLQIWDTAGQERFRSMAPMYYRSAAIAILVYDITSRESFDSVKGWYRELNDRYSGGIVVGIAGNKEDLPPEYRQVTAKEAQDYADSIDAIFFETSAKADTGIKEMFTAICRRLLKKQELLNDSKAQVGETTNLEQPKNNNNKSCCS
eukprot:TRINITY_DN685_c0_g1_i1.p1 TRINITY_DN685_c0_g1~~TRINITY_DN685_c0_g1_i1.p1  ORF type:complete len:208 (-),score=44.27 TRINITY_DN685_c0_g1_i1:27-650(-)